MFCYESRYDYCNKGIGKNTANKATNIECLRRCFTPLAAKSIRGWLRHQPSNYKASIRKPDDLSKGNLVGGGAETGPPCQSGAENWDRCTMELTY
jgi:hypothetical protein